MPPRRRTTKQVKREEEEEDVRPISEEGEYVDLPEAEINALRKKAERDKETGRMYLDALVLVCFVVFIRQLYRYARAGSGAPALLKLVALAQTLLIPFSVTPERLPVLGPQVAGYHHLVVLGQLLLFGISFVLQIGQVPITELLRAALPELLAFSVELQRRAERSNDVELDKLERLKYPLKGA